MTQAEFEKKITSKIKNLDAAKLIFPAAQNALDSMRERIFGAGIGGDGAKIGSYSTKEMYASKSQFKRSSSFRPQGKASKTTTGRRKPGSGVFANGNPRKSMYLSQGYKELRAIQGMESGYVNLHYSGFLFTDFTKLTTEEDSVVLKLSKGANVKKFDALTKKYGAETFRHTQKEKDEFAKGVLKALTKYLNN